MNQLFETQLQVVQRALADVVSPALRDAGSQVNEQLALSIATLAFMQQRLPYARRYYRVTVEDYVDMAKAIVELLGTHDVDPADLNALVTQAAVPLDSPSADIADYRRFVADVRTAIAGLTAAAMDTAYETMLDRLIMDRSAPILLRERVWCIPMGFELRPQELPTYDWMQTPD